MQFLHFAAGVWLDRVFLLCGAELAMTHDHSKHSSCSVQAPHSRKRIYQHCLSMCPAQLQARAYAHTICLPIALRQNFWKCARARSILSMRYVLECTSNFQTSCKKFLAQELEFPFLPYSVMWCANSQNQRTIPSTCDNIN